MPKITGSCQCGAVRYETSADPVFAGHCQCIDCKKSTGTGHATIGAFPESAVKITGKTKSYASKADNGGTATRDFCPNCGGRLWFRSSNMPGLMLIMAGSMDNPSAVSPGMAIYQKHHAAWDHFDPKLATFEAMPPMG